MAFANALAFPALNYDDAAFRVFVDGVTRGRSGVVGSTALQVTQQSSAGPTVQIASGEAFVKATGAGLGGSFFTSNDATINSPAFAATSTDGRKDRLVLRVTGGIPVPEIVQGTASGTPAEPSITGSNFLELALVTLPGGTTNITTAMITDRRAFVGGDYPRIVTSSTRPGSYVGRHIYEADTGRMMVSSDGLTWDRGPWFLPGGRSQLALVRNSIQTIASGSATGITMTATANDDGWTTPDGGVSWQVPAGLDGLYAVRIRTDWGASGGTILLAGRAFIQIRSGVIAVDQSRSLLSGDGTLTHSDILPLAVGDMLRLEVYQETGSSQNLAVARLNAYRLGA